MKRGGRILGLRGYIIGGIVILVVAATGIMGILSLKVIEQKVLYAKVREAEALGDLFRLKSGEKPGAIKDFAELTRRAGRIKDYVIADKTGALFFKSAPGAGAMDKADEGRLIIQKRGMTLRHSGQTTLNPLLGEFNAKVLLSDGVRVSFTLPLAELRGELRSIRRFIFYFSLAASAVIIIFGVYALSRTVLMPIRRLERTARTIAGGNLAVRADEGGALASGGGGYDEIGSLARSFNLMAQSVEDKVMSIERVNRDLLNAQERLIMTEKLATAGRFAAGIAHEIGNPLGAVQGYLEILMDGNVEDGEAAEILERMNREMARINSIVTDFLDISRPSSVNAAPADVNKVIEETVTIMRAHKGFEGVRIEMKVDASLPPAMIDSSKLKQVFMNLLLNSADAMQGSGKIGIETSLREDTPYGVARARRRTDIQQSSAHKVEGEGEASGGAPGTKMVVISFTDNGPGISEEERKKIFDPFFTTKEPGKGMGLGLFISEGIVETYRGKINVMSEEGEGTTFEVVLETA